MKTKSMILAGLVVFSMMVMATCGNSVDDSEDAIINIDFSDFESQVNATNIVYEIDIDGPTSTTIKANIGDKNIHATVSAGDYEITVTAYENAIGGKVFASGYKETSVKPGPNTVTIEIKLAGAHDIEISLDSGTYSTTGIHSGGLQITLTSKTGGEIYYTTNSTEPTELGGTKYTAPFVITKLGDTTIKAKAFTNNHLESSLVLTKNYTLNTTWNAYLESSGGNTTAIRFEFVMPVSDLNKDTEINITGGSGYAKGTLTPSNENKTWTLAINANTANVSDVQVNIKKTGVQDVNKSLTITLNTVWLTATVVQGTNTTAINFTFSLSVSGLTANDITITNGTGAFTKGAMSGSGTSWSLAGTTTKDGSIDVAINKPSAGIPSGTKNIPRVFRLFPLWSAITPGTTDGTTTTFPNSYPTGSRILSIVWANDKFVAAGVTTSSSVGGPTLISGSKMAYSPDGINWNASVIGINFGINGINGISYGNYRFIAVGGGGSMAYSGNGIDNWDAVTSSSFAAQEDIYGIAWGSNKFVAVGGRIVPAKVPRIAYSSNGTTEWQAATLNGAFSSSVVYGVVWGTDKFVAVGSAGNMAYSADGTSWTAVTDSTFVTSDIRGIIWGNNMFVAVGADGKMAFSTNGTSWTPITSTNSTFVTSAIRGITYANNMFVAVGADGKMAYSSNPSNGTSWTQITSTNSTFGTSLIYGIAYANNKFVAVGDDGKIAYSPTQ